jgi:hypothetical protein
MRVSARGIALAWLLVGCAPAAQAAERMWWQHGVATASIGWDTSAKRTLMQKFYIAALGPPTVEEALAGPVKKCASVATAVAADTWKATPGEFGIKTSAAYVSFKASFLPCLEGLGAEDLIEQFEPAFVQRQEWQPGLSYKFAAESPYAAHYRKIGEYLQEHVSGDAGKALNKIMRFQADMSSIDVSGNVSSDVAKAINAAPPVRAFAADAQDIGKFISQPISLENAHEVIAAAALAYLRERLTVDSLAIAAAGVRPEDAKRYARQARDYLTKQSKSDVVQLGVIAPLCAICTRAGSKEAEKLLGNVAGTVGDVKDKVEEEYDRVEDRVKDLLR